MNQNLSKSDHVLVLVYESLGEEWWNQEGCLSEHSWIEDLAAAAAGESSVLCFSPALLALFGAHVKVCT